jgi:ATP-dependent RNA helicase RhlE
MSLRRHACRPQLFMENFSELAIDARLKKNLTAAGFVAPTPVQAGALPPALLGRDILGTAQTGTGKTLAFIIPIIQNLLNSRTTGVNALVLVPTRELAMQVYETFQKLNHGLSLRGALVVGGLSEQHQLQDIRSGARLVIATPGRLDDYIKRRLVNLSGVSVLVIDEADRMVDMGFLPQIRIILNVLPKKRQSMCFSATLASDVAHLVRQHLSEPVRVEIGSTTRHADSVKLFVYDVIRENKLRLLVRLLETMDGTFLVFTRTKYGADRISRKLVQAGLDAAVIHGNRSQNQRTRALKGFQEGKFRVLVATDIAARGIHVDNISHVINFDLPEVPEDFIHRVGRTGRMENAGNASTFVTPEDRGNMARIERLLKLRIERLPVPAGLPQDVPLLPGAKDAQGHDDPLEALRPHGRGRQPSHRARPHAYRHGRGDGPHSKSFRSTSRPYNRNRY